MEETFRVAQQCVDEVLTVTIDEICAAVKDIFEDTRAIAEPAGALALAGLKQWVKRESARDRELVAVFSGANVNFDRLRHIAELAELGEHREALIATTIPERPGSFRHFCHAIGARAITEFNYRYADSENAVVFAGIQLKHGDDEKQTLLDALHDKGFDVADISSEELAKMHIRYIGRWSRRRTRGRAFASVRVSGTARRAAAFSERDRGPLGTSACSTIATTARHMVAC